MLLTVLLNMAGKSSGFFLVGLMLVVGVLFSLNFVVADFNDCLERDGTVGIKIKTKK